jgi:hypothetical protein
VTCSRATQTAHSVSSTAATKNGSNYSLDPFYVDLLTPALMGDPMLSFRRERLALRLRSISHALGPPRLSSVFGQDTDHDPFKG